MEKEEAKTLLSSTTSIEKPKDIVALRQAINTVSSLPFSVPQTPAERQSLLDKIKAFFGFGA